jgi:protein-tyrosine phosphatase
LTYSWSLLQDHVDPLADARRCIVARRNMLAAFVFAEQRYRLTEIVKFVCRARVNDNAPDVSPPK